MLENGLSQFMQFRQQQQQNALAAQADLLARLGGGRPMPRLPLPLPLPFLHAHAAAASKFGPLSSSPFVDNLRARFSGFAAAAAAASASSNNTSISPPGSQTTNAPTPGGPLGVQHPPPTGPPPSLSGLPHPPPPGLVSRANSLTPRSEAGGGLPPLMTHLGQTSPSSRHYDEGPLSPNGN